MRAMVAIAVLMLSGCMTGMTMDLRRAEAVKVVRFEKACADAEIASEMMGSDYSMRFKVRACGVVHTVLCENATASAIDRRDALELLVEGGQTAESRCSIVATDAPIPNAHNALTAH